MKQAFGYTRVSTERQEEEGYGIDLQKSAIREYCERNGLELIRIFDEGAHSARKEHFRVRPVLTEMRELIKAHAVDTVVFYDVSRLSRKAAQVIILTDEARDAGVRFEYTKDRFEDDPVGQMVLYLKASMAEIHGNELVERTQHGLRERVRQGMMLVGVKPPYGYRWVTNEVGRKTHLEIVESEAVVMRRIYRELAGGKSARQVAIGLGRDGYKAPMGGTWVSANLSKQVRNPVYKGTPMAYRYQGHAALRTKNDKQASASVKTFHEGIPAGTSPAIIDEKTWQAAIAQINRGRSESPRNDRHPEDALVRGRVRCGECGHAMSAIRARLKGGGQGKHKYPYPRVYRCTHSTRYGDKPCGVEVYGNVLDHAVWDLLSHLTVADILANAKQQKEEDSTAEDRALITKSIADIKRKQKNLQDSLAGIDDADVRTSVLESINQFGKMKQSLQDDLHRLEAQYLAWRQAQDRTDQIEKLWAEIEVLWSAAGENDVPYAIKRHALNAVDARVTVYRNQRGEPKRATLRLGFRLEETREYDLFPPEAESRFVDTSASAGSHKMHPLTLTWPLLLTAS